MMLPSARHEPTLVDFGLRLVRAAQSGRARALMVLETGGGGTGRHVIDLSRGLIERGYCVTLAYSAGRAEASFLDEMRSIAELQCVRIDMTRELSMSDMHAARAVRAYLREFGPFQLVHGHSSKGGALSRIAALGTKAARVYTPHAWVTLDPKLDRIRRAVYSTAERALSRIADAIICVSRAELDHALELGVDPAKLHLVHNGLGPLPSANRSAVRRRLGLEPGHVCVGHVGRLEAMKAVDRLVRAFAIVQRRAPHARLALVGAGSEKQALRALCARLNLTDSIAFLGNANGPEMMAGFDVLGCTSLYEGFPYVFLEAAQRKLPIVTMKVGGASEVVADGVTGFVVAQDDVSNLAERLVRLCTDAVLRARMAAATAEFAQGWTARRMIEQTIDVYSAATANRQESAKRHGTFRSLLRA